MKSYSLDLREKIVETNKASGITQRELAARFLVSPFFVVKLLGLYLCAVRIAWIKTPWRKTKGDFHRTDARICDSRAGKPKRSDFARIVRARRKGVSREQICLNNVPDTATDELAAQKKTFHSTKRDSQKVKLLRQIWSLETQPQLSKRRIWFLDETGLNLSLAREYARSVKGARALGNKPKNYGDSATLLVAINQNGVSAALQVRGGWNSDLSIYSRSLKQSSLAGRLRCAG